MPPSEEQLRCRDIILSQDYADFIVAYGGNVDVTVGVYEPSCYEIVNSNFLIMHKPLPANRVTVYENYPYSIIPELLGNLDSTSMEQSGILPTHYAPAGG